MDNRPRIVLRNLVSRYGMSLAADPLRTEGLLRDTCGNYHREIFVLVNAIRQKVPSDLLAPRHSLSLILLKDFLTRRLHDELSLSDDAARWAVESWAYALGLASGIPENEPEKDGVLQDIPGSSAARSDPGSIAKRQQWANDLEANDLETRLHAVHDLSNTGDPENIPLIIGALENGNWQVRRDAYDALSGLGDAAIPALTEALADTNDEIVWRASLLLGALKAHDATGRLILLLGRRGIIRECAIWSLGEIGDDLASTPLLKFMRSDDPAVRYEVETALVKIGSAKQGNCP